ncbi:MAG: efflux RND transporter periplasmic adaptor subunit [Betaproteobacteria bacterium]|nr:efflux RND transporter periplasmic adaptor subunit [Betaproteobacteria bacterium]
MDYSVPPSPSTAAAKRVMLFGSVGLIVLAGALLAYFFGSDIRAQDAKSAPRGPAAISVAVAPVKQQDVAFTLNVIGNAEAHATVAVKARVDGQIVEVGFKEGQEVRQGQMLFKIDPRPFETTLRQAEAAFLRDTAQKDQTRSQERRYQELLQKNFVSKEAYAQIRTNAEAADAVALASRAAVDSARLQLEYCTIRSPIDAYPGKIQIQKGNLVKANDANALVVLNQVSPIYVSFAVPEQELSRIRTYMSKGPLAVEAGTPKADKPAAVGQLMFVDNAVDPSTGTIKLRAQFPNKDRSLWPGQFVAVKLKLYDQKNAIVIPTQSVQTGPEGQHVVVVKPDMTAEVRQVIVDRTDGDNTIIAKGLSKGEQVVTQGQMRLAPGTKVAIKPS